MRFNSSVRKIWLGEKEVEYTLRESRLARHMRLTVRFGGELIVTQPRWTSFRAIENFIKQHARWILKNAERYKDIPANLPIKPNRAHFKANKDRALAVVQDRIRHFNALYNFNFNKISIKNQKTRWGSCSRKGNLNFNYKIALLPPHLADYIIVHELCHLRQMNHSRAFWALVAQVLPNHKESRKELRKSGFKYF